jgi:hypothetical protein
MYPTCPSSRRGAQLRFAVLLSASAGGCSRGSLDQGHTRKYYSNTGTHLASSRLCINSHAQLTYISVLCCGLTIPWGCRWESGLDSSCSSAMVGYSIRSGHGAPVVLSRHSFKFEMCSKVFPRGGCIRRSPLCRSRLRSIIGTGGERDSVDITCLCLADTWVTLVVVPQQHDTRSSVCLIISL